MERLVSIIVPFYNVGESIIPTINSIQNQTYRNIEVILIDDGSDDCSANIIAQIIKNDRRFKVIRTINSGPAKARVVGLQYSTGDYIYFCDSDDLIHVKAIEILVDYIEKEKADVAIANYKVFINETIDINCPVKNTSINISKNELMREISQCCRIQNFLWGKLFSRNILFIDDFDQNKIMGEDIATLYKIFDRVNLSVFIEGNPLVYYHRVSTSLSQNLSYKKLNDYCDALNEKTEFIKVNFNSFFHLTFNYNIDFWLLIISKYDISRIKNIRLLKNNLYNSCTGIANRIKLFIAMHPILYRKLFNKKQNTDNMSKKKIAVINTYNSMSTGRVAKTISDSVSKEFTSKLFYGRCYDKWDGDSIYIGGSRILNLINNIYVKLSGNIGGSHKRNTKRLIKQLNKFNPNIIHLHNIHGNYLNYKMLFEYLKDKKVVVTMHDCFWLTGRCAHFITKKVNCSEWKNECLKCRYKNIYMKTIFFDKAHKQYKLKQKFINECNSLIFVSLSNWQSNLFKDFENVYQIPNGFDFTSINDKVIKNNGKIRLIGISQNWTDSKGLDDFKFLSKTLDKNKYEIVLIGKNKKKRKICNISFLGTLDNKKVIDEISKSDIFVNPTYVDTFPTVLIEALSCNKPIITYDVGGCKDIVGDCGVYVERGNKFELFNAILSFDFAKISMEQIKKQRELFTVEAMCKGYLRIYNDLINK